MYALFIYHVRYRTNDWVLAMKGAVCNNDLFLFTIDFHLQVRFGLLLFLIKFEIMSSQRSWSLSLPSPGVAVSVKACESSLVNIQYMVHP